MRVLGVDIRSKIQRNVLMLPLYPTTVRKFRVQALVGAASTASASISSVLFTSSAFLLADVCCARRKSACRVPPDGGG